MAYDMTVRQSLVSRFVHLTTYSTSVRIDPAKFDGFYWVYTAQPQPPGEGQDTAFEIELESNVVNGRVEFPEICEAIHLGYHKRSMSSGIDLDTPSLLIVGERNGRMERIQLAKIYVDYDNMTGVVDCVEDNYLQEYIKHVKRYDKMMRKSLKTIRIG